MIRLHGDNADGYAYLEAKPVYNGESYVVAARYDDEYVKRNGHWMPARHLEHGINSSAEEVNPSFSPDGKFLFWGSEKSQFEIPTKPLQRAQVERLWQTPLNGRANIYFISVEALEAGK